MGETRHRMKHKGDRVRGGRYTRSGEKKCEIVLLCDKAIHVLALPTLARAGVGDTD